MTDKPIPKSLHTVTVLVKLAGLVKQVGGTAHKDPAVALDQALAILGYSDTPDTHGLRAAALKVLGGAK